jgi:ribonucleotide reductase alpha subunit
MYVINRRNEREAIRYDKITDRNIELSKGLNVDATYLSKLVIESLKSGMTTTEIDELAAETAFYMSTYEPDYDVLATRISVSNLHKQTSSSFYETVKKMYDYIDEKSGKKSNVISDEFMKFVEDNKDELDTIIDYSHDFNYNYFGFKTLTRMYLNKLNGVIVERPQHMLMRVAVCIHLNDIESIRESYKEMSLGKFTHASPTLFNSGSARPQLASCFLLKCEDDLEHIYETNKRSALISKHGGGIGIDITNVRSKGSSINSTNGKSDGIVPMCKVFNATCNYCNQSGKRKGSIAMYLQPWHPDVFDFLALRYNNPPEELRARDLFTAMWIPDIFMRRVERDEMWSLFDPNVVRELCDTYGEEFDKIYEAAERDKRYVKRIKAREVWKEILHSQQETGLPYICYKDSINRKSNQKNIGLIRSSNLCVSGDTKIFVKNLLGKQYYRISEYKNQQVELCNGKEWTTVTVKQTSEASVLFRVKFSTGDYVDCTDYHRIPTLDKDGKIIFKHLKDCEIGTVLATYTRPICTSDYEKINTDWEFEEAENVSIISITKLDGLHPTYCFTDEKNGTGLFNGVMLGNCAEITEFTDTDSISTCNLASISLPSFVKERVVEGNIKKYYDFEELGKITRIAVRNLNKVIDKTYYPVNEAKTNNLSYRPVGLGIQGLADVFAMFEVPWESALAKALNQLIMEVIYYNSLLASHEFSIEMGKSYDAFEGSPVSQGILQYDMWSVTPMTLKGQKIFGDVLKLDWELLKEKCKKGMANSLLVALMPTASSSQILGNNECMENYTSNIYTRSTISGDFIMVNKHLAKHLKKLNLWSRDIVNKIIENNGSIQNIKEIPIYTKEIYKTVWEISQKIVIDFSADRGAFVDQSQSLNIFMEQPSYAKLSSMHLYGWKKGLKTGSYYIRSKPSRNAVKFTILTDNGEKESKEVEEASTQGQLKEEGKKYILNGKEMICTEDVCTMCSA